jgi:hypothetical protein
LFGCTCGTTPQCIWHWHAGQNRICGAWS